MKLDEEAEQEKVEQELQLKRVLQEQMEELREREEKVKPLHPNDIYGLLSSEHLGWLYSTTKSPAPLCDISFGNIVLTLNQPVPFGLNNVEHQAV